MKYSVITIGREFCTGGLDIAREVARRLGGPMYDKELITLAAKESGLSEQTIAAGEKRPSGSLLYNLYTMGSDLPLSDQVFVVQSQIIRGLADKGPCVIVGRCGDYVLRGRNDVLRVFLHAPLEFRRRRAQAEGAVPADADERTANALLEKEDRRRAAYYNFYSEYRWGEAGHYDLCLNTALGDEVCADLILRAAQG
ncbi:AAA family ATPase [Candidatus Allofournierella excrementavium]|uniref:cytidylate kinase-like family protein n=1 Tax=Candidatus Allofournierella excrementavium TaxID=2838591 RepID=UPI003AF65510